MRHLVLASLAALALTGTAAAQERYLEADHADVVRLPAPAYTVVIGNPSVADAVIHDRSTLILTGRLHGRTNIIALDARGRVIYAQDVVVGGTPDGGVTLYRGANRTTYACGAQCEAIPAIGDDPERFDALSNQGSTRLQSAAQAVAAGDGGSAPLAGGRE